MDGGIIGDPEETGTSRQALERAIDLLEQQRREGLHHGAQIFVARRGRILVNAAIGEVTAGIPLATDSVMLWFSATKPLTAVAIAQLWEQGKLSLDDPVSKFIPEFAAGKEKATVQQVLTHTGGFPMDGFPFLRYDWATVIEKICEEPAEWEPGTAASYHQLSGWCILGEIIRRIDGRPIEQYLDDEVFRPLAMKDSSLNISPAREAELGKRLSSITETAEPRTGIESWNDPRARPRVLPGGSGYGPANDLGRFYLALSNGGVLDGARILQPETVQLFTATHRSGMADRMFSAGLPTPVSPPWGLGFGKGSDQPVATAMGRKCTAAAYGHGGNRSSIGFVEPSQELVVTIVANGLPDAATNLRRLCTVSDAIHTACDQA